MKPGNFLTRVLLLAACLLPLAAHGQITFINATSASAVRGNITFVNAGGAASAASGNVTPGLPAGVTENDLMVLLVESHDNVVPALPAGWNLLSQGQVAGVHQASIFWRIAGAAAEVAPLVTHAAGGRIVARIFNFRGAVSHVPASGAVPPTPPFDAVGAFTLSNPADTTVNAGAITTLSPNAMLVFPALIGRATGALATPTGAGNTPWTNALGGTAVSNSGGGAAGSTIGLYYGLRATAQLWNAVTATIASAISHGQQIALRPPLTIDVPAGTADGDVMIAAITARPDGLAITPPAGGGWNLVNTVVQAGGSEGNTLWIYSRTANAEPARYTWTVGATSTGVAGTIMTFRGVDTASPIIAFSGAGTGNSTTHDTPGAGISTAVANAMVVTHHMYQSSGLWPSAGGGVPQDPVAPTGAMTRAATVAVYDTTAANQDIGISLGTYYRVQASAANTGQRSAQATGGAGDNGIAHILALRPAVTFNHYAISGPSGTTFATCEPAVVRITAHDASHVAVNPPAGTALTIRTSTNTGVWQAFSGAAGDLGTGANFVSSGANNGQAGYTWSGSESILQVRLRHNTATAPTLSVNLNPAGAPQEVEDPAFTFANSVLRVTADGTTSANIGAQIAGKASNQGFGTQSLFVQAVATAPATGVCTTLFRNQTVNVEFAAVCENPAACSAVAGTDAAVRNDAGTFVSVAKNNGPGAPSTYTAVPLAFSNDANAMAIFAARYGDAGQLRLEMRAAQPSPPAGTYISGASNSFVVRPFGFHLDDGSGGSLVGVAGPGGAVFKKAGESFNVRVTAVVWQSGDDSVDNNGVPDAGANLSDNAATPNFGLEAAPATVTVTHTLVAPAGGAAGAITGGVFSGFAGGAKTNAMTWSEVGSITLAAALTSGNYLGSGFNVSGSVSPVGRFRPDHFLLTPGTLTNRQLLACGPASIFTYQGEGFRVAFMLSARNGLGTPTTTANYTTASGFAKLDGTVPANFGFGAVDLADATPPAGATALTGRLAPAASSGTWLAGVANFTADLSITRAAPDGPFESFRLGVLPADSDGVTLRAADLNLDTDVPANGNDRGLAGSTRIRFGRLAMGNRSGSPLLPLQVPVEAQYWNGTSFITNTDDGCTTLPASGIALGNYQANLNACETSVTVSGFAKGRSSIGLSAPGNGNNGSVDLTANLGSAGSGTTCIGGVSTPVIGSNRLYLQGNWTGGAYTQDPVSRATFGVFPGADEVIFTRENF